MPLVLCGPGLTPAGPGPLALLLELPVPLGEELIGRGFDSQRWLKRARDSNENRVGVSGFLVETGHVTGHVAARERPGRPPGGQVAS